MQIKLTSTYQYFNLTILTNLLTGTSPIRKHVMLLHGPPPLISTFHLRGRWCVWKIRAVSVRNFSFRKVAGQRTRCSYGISSEQRTYIRELLPGPNNSEINEVFWLSVFCFVSLISLIYEKIDYTFFLINCDNRSLSNQLKKSKVLFFKFSELVQCFGKEIQNCLKIANSPENCS